MLYAGFFSRMRRPGGASHANFDREPHSTQSAETKSAPRKGRFASRRDSGGEDQAVCWIAESFQA